MCLSSLIGKEKNCTNLFACLTSKTIKVKMYPLKVMYSADGTHSSTKFLVYNPWAVKFNLTFVKKLENILVTLALFTTDQLDYISGRSAAIIINNTQIGPVHSLLPCHIASRLPSARKNQTYDFMNIFYAVDYYTILGLLMVILIISLAYGSWRVEKLSENSWIIFCNLLKNSIKTPKSSGKKFILTCFAVFITLFHTIFLGFLNTNVMSTSDLEAIESVNDLIEKNISLLDYNNACYTQIKRSEDEQFKQIKAIMIPWNHSDPQPLQQIFDGKFYLADLKAKERINLWIDSACQKRWYSISELKKVHISSHAIGQVARYPFWRKNLPKKIVKKLRLYTYQALEAGLEVRGHIHNHNSFKSLVKNLNILECFSVFDKLIAKFDPLSLGYLKTTYLYTFVGLIVAIIAFICELYY